MASYWESNCPIFLRNSMGVERWQVLYFFDPRIPLHTARTGSGFAKIQMPLASPWIPLLGTTARAPICRRWITSQSRGQLAFTSFLPPEPCGTYWSHSLYSAPFRWSWKDRGQEYWCSPGSVIWILIVLAGASLTICRLPLLLRSPHYLPWFFRKKGNR